MASTPAVHIIDDDDAVRDALSILLRTRGLEVQDYASPELFLAVSGAARGCILTDVQMPRMSGLDLLRELKAAEVALPVIVMTGRAERSTAAEAVRQGAMAFVDKPFGAEEILAIVQRALAVGAGCA